MAYRSSYTPPPWSIKGSIFPYTPIELSRWEKFLVSENLEENDALTKNPKVRDFVTQHHRSYFVPTKVLKIYGMEFGDA